MSIFQSQRGIFVKNRIEMKKNVMAAVAACLLIFIAAPWIPTWVVNLLVANYVAVFIILAANLYLLRVDAVLSLTFFLAAGALFLEYRKRMLASVETDQIIESVRGANSGGAPVSALTKPAENLIEGEVHPDHDVPSSEEHSFEPSDENQTNAFGKPGFSIDEKHVIPTEEARSASEMGDKFIKAGLVV